MRVLTALRAGGISRAWRVPVYQTVAILWFDNTHYWNGRFEQFETHIAMRGTLS